jgi:hypothetical protein
MSDSLAIDYAESVAQGIRDNVNAGNVFGLDPDTGEELNAYDYLQDALDIVYSVGGDRSYRGARILVGFGGPNVWVDTNTNALEVYWGDSVVRYLPGEFIDQLDAALAEIWEAN